jgi:hypothetical protein
MGPRLSSPYRPYHGSVGCYLSLIPSMNLIPRTTSVSSGEPFNDRQPFDAPSISSNTIVRHAALVPLPLVLS